MKRGVISKDFSPEQTRAIRQALAAFGCRMEILSRCSESPSQALEATLRDIRISPSLLAEWIPYKPGVNDDLPELFRQHGKLLWRVLVSLKCDAGQRIFRGEEAQQAIRNAISEYSPSRSGGTDLSKSPAEYRLAQTAAPDHAPSNAVSPGQITRDAHAEPALPDVCGDPPKTCSACRKTACIAAEAGANVGKSFTRIHVLQAMLAGRLPTVWRWAFGQLRIAGITVPSSKERICFLVSLAEAINLDPGNIRNIRELFESEMR